MTDTYERTICNKEPESGHPHVALNMLYMEERREVTEAFYTVTNTKGEQPIAPRPEELAEGKTPSWNAC